MKTRLLSVLLLATAFPLAAAAQDTPSSSGSSSGSSDSGTSQSDSGTSQSNDNGPTLDGVAGGSDNNSGTGTTGSDGSASGQGTSGITSDSGGATSPDQAGSSTGMASGDTFVTIPGSGTWQLSRLQGKTVYSSDGSNIGEINDVVLSQNGSVNAVIIGVGGFLGIGEKNVAVNVSALQVAPAAMSGPTAATGTESDDSDTGPGSNAGADRLVLNVTRAQLEAAPAYTGMGSTQ